MPANPVRYGPVTWDREPSREALARAIRALADLAQRQEQERREKPTTAEECPRE